MRVAIIGSGISGLGAAWALSEHSNHEVTLYEKDDYVGGHTHTVDYCVPSCSIATRSSGEMGNTKPKNVGSKIPVDTGFIVFNNLTYPNLLQFFKHLEVEYINSDMSFSVSRDRGKFEWAGNNLLTVFAQHENITSVDMWRTVYDIIKFNFEATDIIALPEGHPDRELTVGEFLDRRNYSEAFRRNYLLPMTAAIWSTPPDKCSLEFPAYTLIKFMHNHCLLQITNRPQWLTVKNGSRNYVKKVVEKLKDVRTSTEVISVTRTADGKSIVKDRTGKEDEYDHVVFATHGDQTLRILGSSATDAEKDILSKVLYSKNRALLHCDRALMPIRRKAWTSWNYLATSDSNGSSINSVALTYWMNLLQSIDTEKYGDVFVTLNPPYEPQPESIIGEYLYEHPTYNKGLIEAQKELHKIQSTDTSFCGAWTNYGFHEDGLTSGLKVALKLGASPPFQVIDATHIRNTPKGIASFLNRKLFRYFDIMLALILWGVSLLYMFLTGRQPGKPSSRANYKAKN
ncbi:FAD/NAD(P)-binding domain-containing protein [Basidiobolus meristosporus CBS 931.73]|uniref:FAD/NAD(P)-binding domain-containing protein n=1 Tax=Basidiobolus meristosporus CBS 931.73 TaxID=1314790 RepID=A0A1Y1ZD23_9FUNG|nr:FAD/NAD(P)-binding domain-containing protein [Basidiobolus meristosporus CBS 931.73]|eukprot:ORY07715.1 FAD/NAD(P)-binding domain-containing protein [Basidiobolus meristosporus CBS 931.73]